MRVVDSCPLFRIPASLFRRSTSLDIVGLEEVGEINVVKNKQTGDSD